MRSHLQILSLIPSAASCAAAASVRVASAAYFYGYWFSHRRA